MKKYEKQLKVTDMTLKKTMDLGIIIGENSYNFLSFDEYVEHFLLPFSPRFCNIDFAISSLSSIQVKNIVVFVKRDKDIVQNYLVRGWPQIKFYVFDYLDIVEKFSSFLSDFSREHSLEGIIILKGNYPIWFDIKTLRDELEKNINLAIKYSYNLKNYYSGLVVDKNIFIKKYESFLLDENSLDIDVMGKIIKEFDIRSVDAKGYIMPFSSLMEYYNTHIGMIDDYLVLDLYNAYVPVNRSLSVISSSMFGRGSYVINSIVGENVDLYGRVENSIIFSNVRVDRHAFIKNSLILPGNHIGHNAFIINSIIDEYSGDSSIPTIEPYASIGSEKATKVSKEFPEILNFGVTLIGKDVRVPSNMKIGGNCFVDSFIPLQLLRQKKVLKDGETLHAKEK